jgi:putative DNA primase/helicase
MTGTAERIARALGGAYRSGQWWRAICPAHCSRNGSASLALRDGDGGLVTYCHAGCQRGDIIAALRARGLYSGDNVSDTRNGSSDDPAAIERRREVEARDRQRRVALARDMWRGALPAAGTPVERYLSVRVPGLASIPPTLRYLPPGDTYARHPSGSRRPVMLAAVQHDGASGIIGAHRTWLAMDGSGKAGGIDPVRISTGPIGGGAVRLGPAAETLLVGEGIETTLAGMVATGLPGWAALSTSGLAALALPPTVRSVVIIADHDRSGAGLRAAQEAAARFRLEGRTARIFMSPTVGEDANDCWRATVEGVRHAA